MPGGCQSCKDFNSLFVRCIKMTGSSREGFHELRALFSHSSSDEGKNAECLGINWNQHNSAPRRAFFRVTRRLMTRIISFIVPSSRAGEVTQSVMVKVNASRRRRGKSLTSTRKMRFLSAISRQRRRYIPRAFIYSVLISAQLTGQTELLIFHAVSCNILSCPPNSLNYEYFEIVFLRQIAFASIFVKFHSQLW